MHSIRFRIILKVISALIAVTYARPEAGYSYSAPSAPSGNYGPPSPQYGVPVQPPVVHKHVYVHVPPPEPEYISHRKPIHVAPPQKHYKIIFIKVNKFKLKKKKHLHISQIPKFAYYQMFRHRHHQLQLHQ